MLIRLEDIPPEGLRVEAALDPGDPAMAGLEMEGPFCGSFYVNKVGSQVLVRGTLQGEVRLQCARCLRDFVYPMEEQVDVELRPLSSVGSESGDLELSVDDLDVEFFRGDALDLGHVFAEQVSLALPMKALCHEDCRGICPVCGVQRAARECQCGEPASDPRWAGLLQIKEALKKKE